MNTNDQFQSAVTAYEGVKAAKAALKAESKSICEEIAKAKDELSWLQTSYLPLQDVKEGLIQILFLGSRNYEMEQIIPAISGLATNTAWASGTSADEFGKPLKYTTIEKALSGQLGDYPACQILTPNKSRLDDRVFFAVLFKVIEPTIRNIMEKMQPEDFGYNHITPSQIGPGLEERRQMIQAIKAKIQTLEEKKGAIAGKLSALGE